MHAISDADLLSLCHAPGTPPPGSRWRHVRTGNVYAVVCTAVREHDMSVVVCYRSAAGVAWVRPLAEFADGRFARVDPPPFDLRAAVLDAVRACPRPVSVRWVEVRVWAGFGPDDLTGAPDCFAVRDAVAELVRGGALEEAPGRLVKVREG